MPAHPLLLLLPSLLQGLPPCLHNLQLSIPAGCLTAVVGEVGSGKSSLLAALLGELEVTQGFALLPNRQIIRSGFTGSVPQGSTLETFDLGFSNHQGFRSDPDHLHNPDLGNQTSSNHVQGFRQPDLDSDRSDRDLRISSSGDGSSAKPWRPARVSYVGQSPWLMRGSVRDNILMGQPYDAEFMGQVTRIWVSHLLLGIVCHHVTTVRGSSSFPSGRGRLVLIGNTSYTY